MSSNTGGRWQVQTALPVQYELLNSLNLFAPANEDILEFGYRGEGCRRLLAIDAKVGDLYLDKITSYFDHHNVDYQISVVNAVESHKNLDSLVFLLREFERFGLMRRSEPVIAIGGGVLLDLVGLAASIYRRGVPYIRVPTTLLGLIDACVGAKTGINFEGRRNRLGTYYPSVVSYLDRSFLKTLEPVEISAGLGEILKMAVVKDYELFSILRDHGEELFNSKLVAHPLADEVINRSVYGMKAELESNLWETDLERLVDFGHSFSPLLEMRSLSDPMVPSLTHGQAVTLDVIFSSIISYLRNLLCLEDISAIINTTKGLHLDIHHPYFCEPLLLLEALKDTERHRNGNQNLPIPKKIGESIFINDLTFTEITKAAKIMDDIAKKKDVLL